MNNHKVKASKKRIIDTILRKKQDLEEVLEVQRIGVQTIQQKQAEFQQKANEKLTEFFKTQERLSELDQLIEELELEDPNLEDLDILEE